MSSAIRRTLALALLLPLGQALAQSRPAGAAAADRTGSPSTRLIIRMDDPGFCHASNLAVKRILDEGGVFSSVSVIVTTPWIDELAAILREHPDVCVGVHLALNSEWREFRWGPVAPVSEVRSLVDADGKFFGSRRELMANEPKPEEMGKEIRAQIELALRKGLNISYVDYHMGAALSAREFQDELEKAALDYRLGISRYFGEHDTPNVYRVNPEQKLGHAIRILDRLEAGVLNLLVVHPGTDTPEMAALTDSNPSGVEQMSKHRQAITDMLCHPDFKAAIERNGIVIVDYADLCAAGLHVMRRPRVAPPLAEVIEAAKIRSRAAPIEDPYAAPADAARQPRDK